MGSISHAQAIKPDIGKLRKLITSSLQFDWIIKVEYASSDYGELCWRQWDKTFFAIRTTDAVDTVLRAVSDCYKNNSASTIRLKAEKVSPQTQLFYAIYQPHLLATEAAIEPVRMQGSQQTNSMNAQTGDAGDSITL